MSPARDGFHWGRRSAVIAVLAALVVAAVVIGALVLSDDDDDAEDTMSFALGPGPVVEVEKTRSGWRIDLDADLPRLDNGEFYQAWLKNDSGTLVPIGTFNEGEDVVLWAGVSPLEFTTLTVTRERADGDQESSGDRVLIGTLEIEE